MKEGDIIPHCENKYKINLPRRNGKFTQMMNCEHRISTNRSLFAVDQTPMKLSYDIYSDDHQQNVIRGYIDSSMDDKLTPVLS